MVYVAFIHTWGLFAAGLEPLKAQVTGGNLGAFCDVAQNPRRRKPLLTGPGSTKQKPQFVV